MHYTPITRRVTVSGGFHNAPEIALRARPDPRGGIQLSTGQAKRLLRHMCWITGCICDIRHGWVIEGVTRDELSEALYHAQRQIEDRRYK